MHSIPNDSAAASASGTPAIVSWSVSAMAANFSARARRTTSAGASLPSDADECSWRSATSSRILTSGGGLVCLRENRGDFRPRELDGWHLAVRQHLTHLRSGQQDVMLLSVRARARRRQVSARVAVERVLELDRRDP